MGAGLIIPNEFVDAVLRRVIISVFTGAFWLGLFLLLLSVFRVRNPAIRYLFLLVPLAKSLVALVREQPVLEPFTGAFFIGYQFPDPAGFMPTLPDVHPAGLEATSGLAMLPLIVITVTAVAFFTWRFVGVFRFHRLLRRAPEIKRDKDAGLYGILDRLILRMRISYPRLIKLDAREVPFTVGLRKPIIAVSSHMLSELSVEEIEAVLAHELAHIARRDYIYHWPIILMRDLLFFSPMTYFIYQALSFERERACDYLSTKLSQPLTLARGLVKMAELRQTEPSIGPVGAFAPQALIAKRDSHFARRVKELVDHRPYRTLPWVERFSIGFAALFLFYIELHITVMIGKIPVLLT